MIYLHIDDFHVASDYENNVFLVLLPHLAWLSSRFCAEKEYLLLVYWRLSVPVLRVETLLTTRDSVLFFAASSACVAFRKLIMYNYERCVNIHV